jgi:WD40 repeat protein
VRLVSVNNDNDNEDTRRRVRRSELEGLGVDHRTLQSVLDAFGSFRLLSFDRDPVTRGPTVEVAHEALIREWPRYRAWIDERRDDLRVARRLESATSDWLLAGRDPSFLASGVRLERYEQWVESSPVRLTSDERAFIEASRGDERARRQRAGRRRTILLAGVSALAAMAIVAAAVALVQRNRANDEARATAEQTAVAVEAAATAERLRLETERSAAIDRARATMARANAESDPDLRLQLALFEHDALARAGLVEPAVTSALYQAAFDDRIVNRLPVEEMDAPLSPESIVAVTPSPDGTQFVMETVHGTTVSIVDASTGRVTATHRVSAPVVGSVWDQSGERVVTGTFEGTVELWSPAGETVDVIRVSSAPVGPLLSEGGELAYAEFRSQELGQQFRVVAENLATGQEVFSTETNIDEYFVSPSGARVVLVTRQSGINVYDTATWSDVTSDPEMAEIGPSTRVDAAWAGDQHMWLLTDDRLTLFDLATGSEVRAIDTELTGSIFVSISIDERLLAVGGSGDPVRVFDASSGSVVADLVAADRDGPPQIAHAVSVAWGADRRLAVSLGTSTVVWNLAEPQAVASFWPGTDIVPSFTSITPDGERLWSSIDGEVSIFDSAGHLRNSFAADGEPDVPALASPDGTTLALPGPDAVQFVDVATAELRSVAPDGLTRPLALSADGRLAVVGTARDPDDLQHRIAIVDTTSGEQRVNLGGLITGSRSAFTTDGRLAVIPLVHQMHGPEIRVVEVATGRQLGTARGQRCVESVAISPDDALVASLGCDGDIVLLDLARLTGDEPWTAAVAERLEDHTPLVGATFGPESDILIVTRADGRVEALTADADLSPVWSFDVGDHAGAPHVRDGMLWIGTSYGLGADVAEGGMVAMPLDVAELVERARATASRPLTDAEREQLLASSDL